MIRAASTRAQARRRVRSNAGIADRKASRVFMNRLDRVDPPRVAMLGRLSSKRHTKTVSSGQDASGTEICQGLGIESRFGQDLFRVLAQGRRAVTDASRVFRQNREYAGHFHFYSAGCFDGGDGAA